ncbi:MAG TPA: ketoacyl-ACP synthase III [Streptosporangiales bacterium]
MSAEGAARGAAAVGVGLAVPEDVVANAVIAARLGVDEDWLRSRTGTDVRHVARPEQRLEAFAADAATAALRDAGIEPAAVDLVLVGTTSAEEMSPHAAPMVAAAIGAERAGGVDVSAACTGFLSGLAFATAMIETGRAETVVVAGADLLTRYLDPDDRGSAMLFGDGAGAVVLTAVSGPSRVGPVSMHSDGSGRGLIQLRRDEPLIRMDGPTVYRYAVRLMVEVTREVLDRAGLGIDDVDLFVYHQANGRIIETVGKRLGLDAAKVVDVVGEFANTSAASLPIALAWAAAQGRLRAGDRVLLAAFGAGMVWGGGVLQWGRP